MLWQHAENHFKGSPQDLIEIIFEGMSPENWKLLFQWMEGRISSVMTQYGYEPIDIISYEAFISGERSYVVDLNDALGLTLSIIDDHKLEINIEVEDIKTQKQFTELLNAVNEIALITKCSRYYICPEFKPDESFIINGQLVK